MSLKAFHIVFVVMSSLLCAGFGVWALHNALSADGVGMDWVYGVGSLLATVALVIYGVLFLKKLKHISYL
jgi:hypothetical protein